MKNFTHDFDYLRSWAELPDQELDRLYSSETVERLGRIVQMLGNAEDCKMVITRERFASTVRRMRELYEAGSRGLGEAIIQASDLVDEGKRDKAIDVYQRFLASCPSAFYRNIAQTHLEEIE